MIKLGTARHDCEFFLNSSSVSSAQLNSSEVTYLASTWRTLYRWSLKREGWWCDLQCWWFTVLPTSNRYLSRVLKIYMYNICMKDMIQFDKDYILKLPCLVWCLSGSKRDLLVPGIEMDLTLAGSTRIQRARSS